jgi:hypothetical protein
MHIQWYSIFIDNSYVKFMQINGLVINTGVADKKSIEYIRGQDGSIGESSLVHHNARNGMFCDTFANQR